MIFQPSKFRASVRFYCGCFLIALFAMPVHCEAQGVLNPLSLIRTAKNDVQEFKRDYVYEKSSSYAPSDPWYRGKVYRMHTGHWGKYYNCDGEEAKRNSPYICWKGNCQPDFPSKKGLGECIRCEIAKVKQRVIDGAGNCGPGACDATCNTCVPTMSPPTPCSGSCSGACGSAAGGCERGGCGLGVVGRTGGGFLPKINQSCANGVCKPEGFVVGKSNVANRDCGLTDTTLDENATAGLIVNVAPVATPGVGSCNCVECKLKRVRQELETIQHSRSERFARSGGTGQR